MNSISTVSVGKNQNGGVVGVMCPERSPKMGLDKRSAVQASELKHGGIVALHPRQPGVLHCPHGDEQRAAVFGHNRPSQRCRGGN